MRLEIQLLENLKHWHGHRVRVSWSRSHRVRWAGRVFLDHVLAA